jgi:hypothetical protein
MAIYEAIEISDAENDADIMDYNEDLIIKDFVADDEDENSEDPTSILNKFRL